MIKIEEVNIDPIQHHIDYVGDMVEENLTIMGRPYYRWSILCYNKS